MRRDIPEMMTSVSYSSKAARALGLLKSSYNDIEIYVEDTGTPNMWLELLKTYLPDSVRLDSVTALGSRENVIQACRDDQGRDARKKLYVIDGDLDLLRGIPKPRLRYFYRLRGYCVENYFIDEDAFVSAITALDPIVSKTRAAAEFNLSGWLDRNGPLLDRLFVCYAVANELASEERTVGYHVHRLFAENSSNYDFCPSKVFCRIMRLYRIARDHSSKEDVRVVFDRVDRNARRIGVLRFASGKDYIIPPLYKIITSKFKIGINMRSFKILVARSMDKRIDPYLLRRLRVVCQ